MYVYALIKNVAINTAYLHLLLLLKSSTRNEYIHIMYMPFSKNSVPYTHPPSFMIIVK